MTEPLVLHAAEETLEAVHTRRHAAYPAYKPSGVEWLGDVPEHWDVKRLKYVASTNDETLPDTTDPGYEFDYVDIGNVNATCGIVARERMTFEEAPSRARRVVRKGDTIASTVRTYLRAVASVREAADDLIVSTGFAVIRPHGIDPAFLSFALRESHFIETVVSKSTGVSYPAINASEVERIPVPDPPFEEQKAIARFLDEQTQKIDDLIEAKRSLLDLLKEKRQAVITHAVTRGLDPAAKLKLSGVKWLGDVPEHWDVKPLKRLVGKIGSGKTPRGGSQVYVSSGVMLLRSQNVYDDGLRLGDVVFIDEDTDEEMSGTRVKSGDVLLNITGASIGRSSLIPDGIPKANVNQHVCIIRPTKISAAFLHAFICSKGIKNTIASEESGTSREGLNFRQIGRITIPVPTLEEQQAIARFLDEETQKMDDLELIVRDAIATLELLRASIISAAVTGKIDVRGAKK